ncbi:hypothetical protein ACFV4G_39695 [Kitasatospora sp. NPDC059747]|uniref:hypothetical protein n=1 Tax=Kitasatospora sp. NPDC059747 TaxID=3346930 RepID=UPI0036478140
MKPNDRLALAVAVAALVPSVYGAALPPLATVRGEMDNVAMASAETHAMWTAAGIVGAAAIVSGSGEVVVIAGGMAAVYAIMYRRARKAVPGT